MKRMKMGVLALVIAMLAITAAVVGAQPPGGNGNGGGDRGRGWGRGVELTVVAEALGIDAETLQTDLQAGKTIADIATEQDVELSAVIDAVVATQQEALATAVSEGTLTQAQADAQIALLRANLEVRFNETMTNVGGRDGFGRRGSASLEVVATALGIDVETLQTELEAGKTIADIATEQDVQLSVVVDAVVAVYQESLAAAVTDGKLTQAQADAQLELYKANLTERLSQTWSFGGRGDGPMGGGFPGGNGPMGGGQGGRGDHNRPGNGGPGNGMPVPPDGSTPAAPEATPEATAEANA
ncbi:MAG: hypothetical protein LCI00_14245 [Chloroflexi bacterium]|nr:hypothetical protein [Chloroflexota bacterium]MCC6895074.1 hypothetical protein [Anaerolineae bacterium]